MKEINKKTKILISFMVVILLIVSLFTMAGISEVSIANFVPPEEPVAPEDGAEEVPTRDPELSVEVTHPEDQEMTVYFYGGEESEGEEVIGYDTAKSGQEASVVWRRLVYGTTYEWYVEIEDEDENIKESDTWEFTVIDWQAPEDPVSPQDGADGVTSQNPELSVEVTHPEDDSMTVRFYAGEKGEHKPRIGSEIADSGDLVSITWQETLDYGAVFEWYISIEDERGDVRESDHWGFETELFEAPQSPEYPEDDDFGIRIGPDMETELSVIVEHPTDENMDVAFYGGESGEDLRQVGWDFNVESGDVASVTWRGLEYGTMYEWYIEVEERENEVIRTSDVWTFETEYIPNKPRDPEYPEDGQSNVTANPELGVTVRHPEEKPMWVQFYGAEEGEEKRHLGTKPPGDEKGAENGDTVTYTWEDLNYDTTYEWYVEVIEDDDHSNKIESEVWSFETKNFTAPDDPEYPQDDDFGIRIGPDMETELIVLVEHPEEEDMDVLFYGNESGEDLENIGMVSSVESGDEVNLTWSDLQYGTTYEWYISIEDEVGRRRESPMWGFETEYIPNKPRDPEYPEDGQSDVTANPELGVTVRHPEEKSMWVQFYGAEEEENKNYLWTEPAESGDTVAFTWEDLNYDTTYEWYVEVIEDDDHSNKIESNVWSFETKNFTAPDDPEYPQDDDIGIRIGPDRVTELTVIVEHPEEEDMDVLFYGSESGEDLENIGMVSSAESGDEVNLTWSDLQYGTTYEWYISIEDEVGRRRESPTWGFETEYIPNKIRNPEYPEDGEMGLEIGPEGIELAVKPRHPEGRRISVRFFGGEAEDDPNIYEQIQAKSVESGDIARVNWKDIDYRTTYGWYVEVDDGTYSTRSELWEFTTADFVKLRVDVDGEGGIEVDDEEVELPYSEDFERGTEVTLKALPDEGYGFDRWAGDYEAEEEEITILMEDDMEITAYILELYELTIDIEGRGIVEVRVDGEIVEEVENEWSGNFTSGTEVNLTAMPNGGPEYWYFERWTGDYEGEEENIVITIDDNKELTAHFDYYFSIRSRIEHYIPGFTSSLLGLAILLAVIIHRKKISKS